MMDKFNFYRYSAIGLLVLNLAMLAFFFLYRPLSEAGGRSGPPAIHELQMDDQQHAEFLKLAERHRSVMLRINARQKDLLEDYFGQLEQDAVGQTAVFPREFTQLEEEKISNTYGHFVQVKALLRPEQRARFPQFVDRSLRHILNKNERAPRRPKDK